MIKKIFITLFLFIPFSNILLKANADETQNFIVTAYYSPLPDQEYYLKGNYEDEIKLNGRGIRGASGLEVFEGMLAGPKKYSFGTKIYLEGLGTGIIADRGGAIVEAGVRGYDSDRLDVWMGYGDDGLKKALAWGKRKINGKIIDKGEENESSESNIGINFNAKNVNLSKLSKIKKDDIYKINIGLNSSKEKIEKLQNKLRNLGFYKGTIDGIYNNELITKLIDFQLENGIIKSKNDYGAGYWGIKTRDAFYKIENTKGKKDNNKIEVINLPKNIFETYIHPESSANDIIKLQEKLNEIELYNGDISGNYNDIKNILINYQLNNNIIQKKSDIGAGYFGPKTREFIQKDYADFVAKKETEERDRRKLDEIKNLASEQAVRHIEKIGTPKIGDVSQNVRELQKVLTTLGYFEGKDTAIYGEITKQSIYEYQLDKNLVRHMNDPGAGKIGDITKSEIKKDLTKLFLEKKLKEENMIVFNNKKLGN